MLDRVSVLCFGGTYGLALICELARFAVRGRVRWYATVALTLLGWLVQTAYLANLARARHAVPVTTAFESLMVLSWIVALIGLYLMVRAPQPVAVGLFVLPLVLALVVAGCYAPRRADWSHWADRSQRAKRTFGAARQQRSVRADWASGLERAVRAERAPG